MCRKGNFCTEISINVQKRILHKNYENAKRQSFGFRLHRACQRKLSKNKKPRFFWLGLTSYFQWKMLNLNSDTSRIVFSSAENSRKAKSLEFSLFGLLFTVCKSPVQYKTHKSRLLHSTRQNFSFIMEKLSLHLRVLW